MENHGPNQVLWREGTLRCEQWKTGILSELRVYVADVLRYREPVLRSTDVVRQAANLFTIARAAIGSGREPRR